MANSSIQTNLGVNGTREDVFATFRFYVEIGSIIKAVFTECSGLEMNTDFYEYTEGGTNSYVHIFPGRTRYSHITLKRGFALDNDIFEWFKNMEDCLRSGRQFEYQQVSIILRNTDIEAYGMRWDLDRALPIKWAGPSLKSDEAAVAMESLELAHHGITAQKVKAN
jgi:phage tail-like protein